MPIFTTKHDLATWVSNRSPANCVEAGTQDNVVAAMLEAEHPPWGEDWAEWLGENAERIASEVAS